MINKIKNVKNYYRYLLKAKLHLSLKDYFLLFFISLISLIFSFLVIISSLPFLDLILGKSPEEYQEPTKHFINILEIFNFENYFFAFSTIFVLSLILKSVCDIFYNYTAISLQFKFMRQETLDLNEKIFKMNQKFYVDHPSSKIFNLYTRELERASEVISSFMLIVNSSLQVIYRGFQSSRRKCLHVCRSS